MNTATIIIEGKTLELILKEKDFSTGKNGFWARDKLTMSDWRKYKVVVRAVLIDSKTRKLKKEIIREIEVLYCQHCGTKNNARLAKCQHCNATLH